MAYSALLASIFRPLVGGGVRELFLQGGRCTFWVVPHQENTLSTPHYLLIHHTPLHPHPSIHHPPLAARPLPSALPSRRQALASTCPQSIRPSTWSASPLASFSSSASLPLCLVFPPFFYPHPTLLQFALPISPAHCPGSILSPGFSFLPTPLLSLLSLLHLFSSSSPPPPTADHDNRFATREAVSGPPSRHSLRPCATNPTLFYPLASFPAQVAHVCVTESQPCHEFPTDACRRLISTTTTTAHARASTLFTTCLIAARFSILG